jgi:GAF domain-containing protein
VLDVLGRLTSAALENLDLRRRAEERAETDPLTGLHNRYFMDKVLALEIPRIRRYNHPLSVLMIDLLDFKRTNDTHGHQGGGLRPPAHGRAADVPLHAVHAQRADRGPGALRRPVPGARPAR